MLRSIPLKATVDKIKNEKDELVNITYSFLIKTILLAPKREGVQIGSIRKIDSILKALENAETALVSTLLLTEDLWGHLTQAVTSHSWGGYMPSIITFVDDIENAPKVDPNSVAKD